MAYLALGADLRVVARGRTREEARVAAIAYGEPCPVVIPESDWKPSNYTAVMLTKFEAAFIGALLTAYVPKGELDPDMKLTALGLVDKLERVLDPKVVEKLRQGFGQSP